MCGGWCLLGWLGYVRLCGLVDIVLELLYLDGYRFLWMSLYGS